jgi:hypothetical protein
LTTEPTSVSSSAFRITIIREFKAHRSIILASAHTPTGSAHA